MIITALFLLCLLIFLFFKIPNFRWLLFSLLCFSASLGIYGKQGVEVPNFVPALELVRSNGRIISVFLLILLFILLSTLSLLDRKKKRLIKLFPLPIKLIILIRLLGTLKLSIQTNTTDELTKFVLLMILLGVIYLLLWNSKNVSEAIFKCLLSINLSCIIFLLFNLCQWFFNRQALFYAGNLFLLDKTCKIFYFHHIVMEN